MPVHVSSEAGCSACNMSRTQLIMTNACVHMTARVARLLRVTGRKRSKHAISRCEAPARLVRMCNTLSRKPQRLHITLAYHTTQLDCNQRDQSNALFQETASGRSQGLAGDSSIALSVLHTVQAARCCASGRLIALVTSFGMCARRRHICSSEDERKAYVRVVYVDCSGKQGGCHDATMLDCHTVKLGVHTCASRLAPSQAHVTITAATKERTENAQQSAQCSLDGHHGQGSALTRAAGKSRRRNQVSYSVINQKDRENKVGRSRMNHTL